MPSASSASRTSPFQASVTSTRCTSSPPSRTPTPYDEFKEFNNDLPWHYATSTLRSDSNGVIKVPTGPGFEVDIDPDFLRKATVVSA